MSHGHPYLLMSSCVLTTTNQKKSICIVIFDNELNRVHFCCFFFNVFLFETYSTYWERSNILIQPAINSAGLPFHYVANIEMWNLCAVGFVFDFVIATTQILHYRF